MAVDGAVRFWQFVGLAAATAVALLVACSLGVEVHLFNNSTEDVRVTYRGRMGMKNATVKPRSVLDFSSADFEVRAGECTLAYAVRGIPPAGFIEVAGLYRHVHLQLEPDRRIFVLRETDQAPVNVAGYDQPSGYPLVPRRECGEE